MLTIFKSISWLFFLALAAHPHLHQPLVLEWVHESQVERQCIASASRQSVLESSSCLINVPPLSSHLTHAKWLTEV
ncbi:hypothetical protein C8R48DRAFT_461035 [Suillus tomentosus]|nr:hypothetical protein C8R48DRAFT_461035 [Suillus tomentosus]